MMYVKGMTDAKDDYIAGRIELDEFERRLDEELAEPEKPTQVSHPPGLPFIGTEMQDAVELAERRANR